MAPYEELILEHWRNPRNKGSLENPDIDVVEANPLCGDVVRLQLSVKEGTVKDVRFEGQGCAISQAAASLLTEMIKGKTVSELEEMKDEELLSALGGVIKTRLSCALLPLRALRKGLSERGKG
ncbi:SUF system NifU family Fe-S cluster assembly protein [Candidatus Bipolaricaulota bacterium]|nr:SUF system NifU family Fe-S cluster assembly protein [Candidatus Bipolaricaulota bacterium]RLI51791.1 MAG: SUF system NifU family Fe-S cluster assembly protein [Candidatus Thorarchaeota archaeon]